MNPILFIYYQHFAALAIRRIMKRHAASCTHAKELSKFRS